jgi:hypothetical protein
MAEHQLPKLTVRVRFPSSAPETDPWSEALFLERPGSTAINCGWVGPSTGPHDIRGRPRLRSVSRASRAAAIASSATGCCADRSEQRRVSHVPCASSGHAGWHQTERPPCCRCVAGRGGGGWNTDLVAGLPTLSLCRTASKTGAGARRAIRAAATTELIRRPENCHPRCRPADSLMADDGVRRIRLLQVCDLVLGQSDGEGADRSFQMRNLRCPNDGRRHRLLL